ncbi:phosphoribosyltransferase [Mycolicibacillus parakoreensis]|uniref:Phosphoribosyltransferase family protein n=1 Tax=Mycolicibacillus parakoreensis TaxID=1069221 RepID=A0ABY3U655_9MYCO|nr:phosphoribosyltransferase family protein [Mycolicibacillus parakoreensis]MCV7314104.1 phosphoribosyltransferase [Mycolicibacillus parakoreensis]ULN54046.1 phosphoribosyltransferase family protein [Mycolicibacillus parakoreensis]
MGTLGGFRGFRGFRNRREAGRAVAELLTSYRGRSDLLVLGLARGGMPVAAEVAAALDAPLDVFLVRKLGVPHWPELAMGALASGDTVVLNDAVIADARVGDEQLQRVIDRERTELHRRERAYRGDRPPVAVRDKTVLLVDDGIATGASMRVAVQAVRAGGPAAVVVAVPVAPPSVSETLGREADAVVAVYTPEAFEAVGQAFVDFHQVSDDEVRALLAAPR